jgi:hypothetical protein
VRRPDGAGRLGAAAKPAATPPTCASRCASPSRRGARLDATLRFKAVGGSHARAAGLVLRAQSANDYYVVRADALEGRIRLYRMQRGRRAS